MIVRLVSVDDYVRYSTVILLASRLTNPLSLLTRPLLPNYIHALRTADERFLNNVSKALIAGGALIVVGLCCSLLLAPRWLKPWLPSDVAIFSRSEVLLGAVLLGGLLLTTMLFPLFVARRQTVLYGSINFVSMAVALGVGTGATVLGYKSAMLTAVATSAFALGVVALVVLIRTSAPLRR